ncbi:hypothetical protein HMPREF1146_1855 [Prevotella sp. MSX73]|nr:hypothetical protein HMPREF1146_1855 [Prevotella sp. MSX73]
MPAIYVLHNILVCLCQHSRSCIQRRSVSVTEIDKPSHIVCFTFQGMMDGQHHRHFYPYGSQS